MTRPKTAIAILAGGASKRFGSDKRKAILPNRKTILQHACDRWSQACSRSILVGVDSSSADSIESIADEIAFQGPVGGILTALRWAESTHVDQLFIVGADLPLLPCAALLELGNVPTHAEGAAKALVTGQGPILAALVPTSCLERVETFFDGGKRRYLEVLKTISTREFPLPPYCGLGLEASMNVNTPADLAAIHQHFSAQQWHSDASPLGI